ncbi:MAG TPA: hypothetical protein VK083_07945 [Nocardia sp.]|uniref:hypothetical protein n=1 Tax=Nocardia TaxID=1817 RepID=UPI0024590397|nr:MULTISPECIES: hypothetical protein [Nocardia]HLS76702.1 hypothetical protein [Nocardia sp.]
MTGVPEGRELDCLVEITWPAGSRPWWAARHTGTGAQIAAALDELAVRVRIDHWARALSVLDEPLVGYSLTVCDPEGDFLIDYAAAVPLRAVPTVIRAHAGRIRDHACR